MKLRELIREIPKDDWVEVTEQSSTNYRSYIGRAPKKYIVGEVLDYEALYLSESKSTENYRTHRFLVYNDDIAPTDN